MLLTIFNSTLLILTLAILPGKVLSSGVSASLHVANSGIAKSLDQVLKLTQRESQKDSSFLDQFRYNGLDDISYILRENLADSSIHQEYINTNETLNFLTQLFRANLPIANIVSIGFKNKPIKISGSINTEKLQFQLLHQDQRKIDFMIKIQVENLQVSSKNITLCLNLGNLDCDPELAVNLVEPRIGIVNNEPLYFHAYVSINKKKSGSNIKIKKIVTALEDGDYSRLKSNLAKISLSNDIFLNVGKERYNITPNVKKILTDNHQHVSKLLIDFAADFLSRELVEIINAPEALKKVSIPFSRDIRFSEYLDNIQANNDLQQLPNKEEVLAQIIKNYLNHFLLNIGFSKLSFPLGNTVQLDFNGELYKNGSNTKLESSSLAPTYRSGSDLSLSLSTKTLDGILKQVIDDRLLEALILANMGEWGEGLSLANLSIMFKDSMKDQITADLVAQVELDFSKRSRVERGLIWGNEMTKKWARKALRLMSGFNNPIYWMMDSPDLNELPKNYKFTFPVEIPVAIKIDNSACSNVKDMNNQQCSSLKIILKTPFESEGFYRNTLRNTYQRPSNLPKDLSLVTGIVTNAIKMLFGGSLISQTKDIEVDVALDEIFDIGAMINKDKQQMKDFKLNPVAIRYDQNNHLVLEIDLGKLEL